MVLAVRNDALAALAGTDGDYAPFQVDASGALFVVDTSTPATPLVDDAAFTPGTSIVTAAAGIYRSVRDLVNDNDVGALAMTIRRGLFTVMEDLAGDSCMDESNNALQVNVVAGTLSANTEFAEDIQHTTADKGIMSLTVRNDSLAALATTDGDYAPLQVNASGALYVEVTAAYDAPADSTTFSAGQEIIVVGGLFDTTPAAISDGEIGAARMNDLRYLITDLTELAGNAITLGAGAVAAGTLRTTSASDDPAVTALQLIDNPVFVEDVAFSGGSVMMGGAIRDDSLTTLTPADGDAVPLRVGSTGALHVTGGGGGTEYTEDVATANPIVGTATLMERDDQLSTLTPVAADWASYRCTSKGALWVAMADGSGDPITSFGASASVHVDDAGFTLGTDSGSMIMGFAGTQSVDANDAAALTCTTGGFLKVIAQANSGVDIGDVTLNAGTAEIGKLAAGVAVIGEVTIGAATGAAGDLAKIEDAQHSSGDVGIMMLGVENADQAALTAGDKDYTPIATSAEGNVLAHLMAGTNAFGKLAANTGVDIGDVDILSIAAGDNNIGNVDIVSGTITAVTDITNTIDSTISGAALTALQLIDNAIFVDDADFTVTSSSMMGIGAFSDAVIVDASGTAGDLIVARVNDQGALWTETAHIDSTDDCIRDDDLDETAAVISANAGVMYGCIATNLDATPVFVHFYNVAAASVTVGTTVGELSICIPSQGDANGAAGVFTFPKPLYFDTACSMAATTTVGGNTGPGGNELFLNVWYRDI